MGDARYCRLPAYPDEARQAASRNGSWMTADLWIEFHRLFQAATDSLDEEYPAMG